MILIPSQKLSMIVDAEGGIWRWLRFGPCLKKVTSECTIMAYSWRTVIHGRSDQCLRRGSEKGSKGQESAGLAKQLGDFISAPKSEVTLRWPGQTYPRKKLKPVKTFWSRESSVPSAPNVIVKEYLLILYLSLGTFLCLLNILIASADNVDIHCSFEHDVTWLERNIASFVLQVNKVNSPINPVT